MLMLKLFSKSLLFISIMGSFMLPASASADDGIELRTCGILIGQPVFLASGTINYASQPDGERLVRQPVCEGVVPLLHQVVAQAREVCPGLAQHRNSVVRNLFTKKIAEINERLFYLDRYCGKPAIYADFTVSHRTMLNIMHDIEDTGKELDKLHKSEGLSAMPLKAIDDGTKDKILVPTDIGGGGNGVIKSIDPETKTSI